MAVVRLSDAFEPVVYASYGEVNSPELTAFLSSGIVSTSPLLTMHALGPSTTGTIPYWNDLDATVEVNYSNDDPADFAVPQKITAAEQHYRKTYINQGWSDMDLVAELMGSDPMRRIRSRTSTYFLRQLQRRIVAIARGLYAENLANDASDMIIDVSTEDGNAATAANRLTGDAVINSVLTMGDAGNQFTAIAVHSLVKGQMLKNDEIAFVRASDGSLLMEQYKGLMVITDDGLPVIPGTTSGFRFISVLFGRGMIGMGVGAPSVSAEVIRVPSAGQGGGQETLWERKTWLLHPFGHDWVEGALVEMSPTLADLALASHWDRLLDRKQVPIAFLVTN